jgi:hypothetical protein
MLRVLVGFARGAQRGVMTSKKGNKNFYKGALAAQQQQRWAWA